MFEIVRYTASHKYEWNQFVAQSKNGTFLFDRNYMDYHNDRFEDHSLLFYKKGKLYALLAANEKDHILYSHQGLTYGGLITTVKTTTDEVLQIFQELNAYYKRAGFHKIIYKAIPSIYHKWPSEEDLYALTSICQARLIMRDISSTILLNKQFPFTESRKSGMRKASQAGIQISESDDFDAFWNILQANLHNKYGINPVHTAAELKLLKSRFPHQIRLFLATLDDKPLGGTILFITPTVVHTQYISANEEGKQKGAIDLLFKEILKMDWNVDYFDFGKSTSTESCELNRKLIFQKEGFGGRGVCYDTYEWTL